MCKVKIKDFVDKMRIGKYYAFKSIKGQNGIKLYPFSHFGDDKYLIAKLPYTHNEWSEFCQRHNCRSTGDYYMHGKTDKYRFFHKECEDGIEFEISAGKDIQEKCESDWIRIMKITENPN